MGAPKYDRPELRPESKVPNPRRPQPQGPAYPKDGQGGGNDGK